MTNRGSGPAGRNRRRREGGRRAHRLPRPRRRGGPGLAATRGYRRLRVLPGEILLLCSDGFHHYAGLNHLKFLRKLQKYAETLSLGRLPRR